MNWIEEIARAHRRIRQHVLRTPLFHSPILSGMNHGDAYLKLESEQYTGSFKARGALNKLLSLTEQERQAGLVTASTGNHAQGFGRACRVAGVRGTVFLPENADESKVESLGQYPVDLEFYGTTCVDAELRAKAVARERGQTWVSPYNDPMVIAGQGTIGLEMLEQCSGLDRIFVCIGGGGLVSGIATWCRHHSPGTKIVGCLPEAAPEMYLSVKAGKVVALEKAMETLSDGSAGGLEEDAMTFAMCRELVDDYVLVSETEIADTIRFMVDKHHKIVEGAAAVAIAGFMKQARELDGETVAVVVCGANISMTKLKSLL
jgi:threonine dehydratase